MPEAGWPRVHQHQTTANSNRSTAGLSITGVYRSHQRSTEDKCSRGSTPEWRTREEWALPLRQGCDIAPSAISFHIRSFLMAGWKKSGAGDAEAVAVYDPTGRSRLPPHVDFNFGDSIMKSLSIPRQTEAVQSLSSHKKNGLL